MLAAQQGLSASVAVKSVRSRRGIVGNSNYNQFALHHAKCTRRGSVHLRCRAAAADEGEEEQEDKPPPGCARFTIELKKPLGLVLVEKKDGGLIVVSITTCFPLY